MFDAILGHEAIKQMLEDAIVNDTISHAYLFSGMKGIGKKTLAEAFAKEILQVENLESCPDYQYICKKEDKKDIIVEQIRTELIDDIYLTPVSGKRKVYVIDDAQCLNMASQNALLKTLEEPPSYVTVILISSNISSFLTTILSRVNKIEFQNLPSELVIQFLKDKYQVSLSNSIIDFLEGSIGAAVQIIQENIQEKFMLVDKLYQNLERHSLLDVIKLESDIVFTDPYILDYLEYLVFTGKYYGAVKIIEKAKLRLKMNGNYDIVIDNMLIKLLDEV